MELKEFLRLKYDFCNSSQFFLFKFDNSVEIHFKALTRNKTRIKEVFCYEAA